MRTEESDFLRTYFYVYINIWFYSVGPMRISRYLVLNQWYFTGWVGLQCIVTEIETKPPMKCQNVSAGWQKFGCKWRQFCPTHIRMVPQCTVPPLTHRPWMRRKTSKKRRELLKGQMVNRTCNISTQDLTWPQNIQSCEIKTTQ